MKRSRFSEEQIIGILKEHQAGMSAADLCRKHGVSDATFYKWRSKYGGMEVSAPAHPAEAGGHRGEPEEGLPTIQGGRPDRAQARRP